MLNQPRPLPEELADFVRRRRKDNRMSQSELADLAGVGRRFVSELESGRKSTLRLGKIEAVLKVFGSELSICSRSDESRRSSR